MDSIWVDTELKYVIKWRMDNNEAHLTDFKQATLPAELFLIPENYAVLQPVKTKFRKNSK
jgi:hypothetical protein